MKVIVYRVQAEDGRGPWRPGLSRFWVDESSDKPLQSDVMAAFGLDWINKIPHGWHAGCACRTLEGAMEWFTPVEQQRLSQFGYSPVQMCADKIIEENTDQVVFARKLPFTESVVILSWPELAKEEV